jgi:hypothetical protein
LSGLSINDSYSPLPLLLLSLLSSPYSARSPHGWRTGAARTPLFAGVIWGSVKRSVAEAKQKWCISRTGHPPPEGEGVGSATFWRFRLDRTEGKWYGVGMKSNKSRVIKCADTGECFTSYREYLRSDHWAYFKAEFFRERESVCRRCGRDNVPLDLHHVSYARIGNEFLDDVQPLCRKCHDYVEQEKRPPTKSAGKAAKHRDKRRQAEHLLALVRQQREGWSDTRYKDIEQLVRLLSA